MERHRIYLIGIIILVAVLSSLITSLFILNQNCDDKLIIQETLVTKETDCLQYYYQEYQDIERLEKLVDERRTNK